MLKKSFRNDIILHIVETEVFCLENYPEVTEPKNGKKFTVGKLFKWLAILIILLIYTILIVYKIINQILGNILNYKYNYYQL